MTETHKCPDCQSPCACERGTANPKDCVHYECFTGIPEPDVTRIPPAQKEQKK